MSEPVDDAKQKYVRPNCKVCFGTGWQPLKVGDEWLKWPCQACIEAYRAANRQTGVAHT